MVANKIIIDTDPGVDDIMAMLLALSAKPEELEVLMLSVTYGNVPLQSCLRNVVALFHVLEKEIEWRKSTGRASGYETMLKNKPIVAVGPEHPLEEEELMADFFHGADGLHNVHDAHPHLTPAETWKTMFDVKSDVDASAFTPYFTPSKTPSHLEMLRILKENPADTVSILAVGPLTNVALAAAEDPETFLRVKELVVMGGAVHVEDPASTMPPIPKEMAKMSPYPSKLSRQLKLVLCPLDITTPHGIGKKFFSKEIQPYLDAGSPLAQWTSHFIQGAFNKIDTMEADGPEPELSLHDPLTVWYAMSSSNPAWKFPSKPEDIRVETTGQWTRGMHVIDNRNRKKPAELAIDVTEDELRRIDDVPGDDHHWLSVLKGNRIHRVIASPGEQVFKEEWMKRVFA